ncbi:MAG: hypothetical protein K5860_02070 [Bacteroidales bacterium]|nr:hypothetical protein [Bacteroidales bacterium]
MKKLLLFILLLPVFGYSQEFHSKKQFISTADTSFYQYKSVDLFINMTYRATDYVFSENPSQINQRNLSISDGSKTLSYFISMSTKSLKGVGELYRCYDDLTGVYCELIISYDYSYVIFRTYGCSRPCKNLVKETKYFL